MRLLVLGGTHPVGRAVAEAALTRGDDVTTLNRGTTGRDVEGVRTLRADRANPGEVQAALGDQSWDAVIDTWSGAPVAVSQAAAMLAGRAGHYGYVSSCSVYPWPPPVDADENAAVVAGDPADTSKDDSPAAKRGGELGALAAFGDRALLARAGLIIGPYEIVGRLPWWLGRLARGGDVLAPGPASRPLQYIDGRDLAAWMLSAADRGLGGTFNADSRTGQATMGSLLEAAREVTGGHANLVWMPGEVIQAAGIEPWTDLPIWVPPDGEFAGFMAMDVSAIYAAGLTCRPVTETVADAWQWLQAEGFPEPPAGRRAVGLDQDREQRMLASR